MRKILDALNSSGMYGPVKEWSLEMLSKKKRVLIAETLLRTALKNYDVNHQAFEFELIVSGFYYRENDCLESSDPKGKRAIAEKFL